MGDQAHAHQHPPQPQTAQHPPSAAWAGSDRRLPRSQVELVLRRAIELQDVGSTEVDPGLRMADLQDIARQLGVDPALIPRAARDVHVAALGQQPKARWESVLGPAAVRDARAVAGDPAAVHAAVRTWMSRDEGMTLAGTRGGEGRWVKDKRLLVQIRRGLQVERGDGVLRDLKDVQVAVTPDEGGTIVQVRADTTPVRNAGAVILTVGGVLSAAAGATAAGVLPDLAIPAGDVVQFLAVAGTGVGMTLATAATVTRSWTRKVRDGVSRALDGIAMTSSDPHPPLPLEQTTGWRRTAMRWLGGD